MPTRFVLSIIASTLFFVSSLYADYPFPGVGCDTALDPARTRLTILGDSLSQLVSAPAYGAADWEVYLTIHRPDTDWSVQNLATAAMTTDAIYDRIRLCAQTDANRNTFKMAANVAFESGGNDFILNLPTLIILPWVYPNIEERVRHNKRLLIKALKHPRRHKNVLVMGNFPTIATSPTLGKTGNFFKWWQNTMGFPLAPSYSEIMRNKLLGQTASGWRDQLEEFAVKREMEKDMSTRAGALELLPQVNSWIDSHVLSRPHCSYMEWYCAWLEFNKDNFGLNSVSIAMLFHQGPLEAMAREEGAEFLPLYPYFIRHADCALGHCYVGQPALYNDPVHVSYLGYFAWSGLLANKLNDLNWTALPTNGGLIDVPATAMAAEEAPLPPQVHPDPLQWLALCIVFHWCHL